jgi:hypothetical protein
VIYTNYPGLSLRSNPVLTLANAFGVFSTLLYFQRQLTAVADRVTVTARDAGFS